MKDDEYYIVDVREEWRGKPYITVWRPNNNGYAYPLSWSGRYSREQIDAEPRYYHSYRYPSTRVLDRFPVPCAFVEAMAVDPYRGDIDGDTGPVVLNNKRNRAKLRRARYNPIADMVTS